ALIHGPFARKSGTQAFITNFFSNLSIDQVHGPEDELGGRGPPQIEAEGAIVEELHAEAPLDGALTPAVVQEVELEGHRAVAPDPADAQGGGDQQATLVFARPEGSGQQPEVAAAGCAATEGRLDDPPPRLKAATLLVRAGQPDGVALLVLRHAPLPKMERGEPVYMTERDIVIFAVYLLQLLFR